MNLRKMTQDEIDQINSFIPKAKKFADNRVVNMKVPQAQHWVRVYCDKMNELAIAEGLRVDLSGYRK